MTTLGSRMRGNDKMTTLGSRMNETRALAEYALRFKLDDCPAEVIHQAKRCTLETFACALGGSRTPLARAAIKALARMGEAVVPAKAGTQGLSPATNMDSAFRRNDSSAE